MANLNLIIHVDHILKPEKCAGEICLVCEDPIYGDGYALVSVLNFDGDDLPMFCDTTAHCCQSCREALPLY